MQKRKENVFIYRDINKHLINLKDNDSIDIQLIISMERGYYEGDIFFKLIQDIKNNLLNNSNYIISNSKKIYVNKFTFLVADSLNKRNWYYRYALDYMNKNGLNKENEILDRIKKDLKHKALLRSKEQGLEWILNNSKAIELLIPDNITSIKNIEINDKITVLTKASDTLPQIEIMRYDNLFNHPKFNCTKDILSKICHLENSIIERNFKYEATYFYNRQIRMDRDILDKDFFINQSMKYLFDETVAYLIDGAKKRNLLEFYFNGKELPSSQCFRGKKAQNDPVIKKYLQNELKGADQRKFVSIKLLDRDK